MAMGTRRQRERQEDIWLPQAQLASAPGHPFYQKLNELLEGEGFDEFVEQRCAKFYQSKNGRPSLTPGIYFRSLMIGYFEGIRRAFTAEGRQLGQFFTQTTAAGEAVASRQRKSPMNRSRLSHRDTLEADGIQVPKGSSYAAYTRKSNIDVSSPPRTNVPCPIEPATHTPCGSILRVPSLKDMESSPLQFHDIGAVEIQIYRQIFCEAYSAARALKSFIVIDVANNTTVSGGMILDGRPSLARARLTRFGLWGIGCPVRS